MSQNKNINTFVLPQIKCVFLLIVALKIFLFEPYIFFLLLKSKP